MIPDGFEYALRRGEETVWCVRRERAHRALCGAVVSYCPVLQPVDPVLQPAEPAVHAECLRVLAGCEPVVRVAEYGGCPSCGGEAPVAGGVVLPHPEWVMSAGGPVLGSRRCDGEGQEPE